jgi:peptidoglycan/xylan/chitin deacetylase (PgdA/CDA1 family)
MKRALAVALVVAVGLLGGAAVFWHAARLPHEPPVPPVAAEPADADPAFDALAAEPPVEPPATVTVPILVYHNVRPAPPPTLSRADLAYEITPRELEAQFAYLADHSFTTVSFAALMERLAGGRAPWPERPVIISFDDGRRSQLDHAVPLLAKHGLTATFFVFTNAPDRNGDYMTWAELAALKAAGHEIGSHTVLHEYLTRVDDGTMNRELARSRADIEAGVGEAPLALAYPFGLVDGRVAAATEAAGYAAARGLGQFTDITLADRYALPGFIVTGDFGRFVRLVEGE